MPVPFWIMISIAIPVFLLGAALVNDHRTQNRPLSREAIEDIVERIR